MTRQGLDPPQRCCGNEAGPRRAVAPHQWQKDPRQPAVCDQEVGPFKLGDDATREDHGHGREDCAVSAATEPEGDQPGSGPGQREVKDTGHVERFERRQQVDEPVGRVEGADLALGVERIADPSWSFQSGRWRASGRRGRNSPADSRSWGCRGSRARTIGAGDAGGEQGRHENSRQRAGQHFATLGNGSSAGRRCGTLPPRDPGRAGATGSGRCLGPRLGRGGRGRGHETGFGRGSGARLRPSPPPRPRPATREFRLAERDPGGEPGEPGRGHYQHGGGRVDPAGERDSCR